MLDKQHVNQTLSSYDRLVSNSIKLLFVKMALNLAAKLPTPVVSSR